MISLAAKWCIRMPMQDTRSIRDKLGKILVQDRLFMRKISPPFCRCNNSLRTNYSDDYNNNLCPSISRNRVVPYLFKRIDYSTVFRTRGISVY
jgi:hypothetical protein